MRITITDNYDHKECELGSCERRYCATHRLLWRECETVKEEVDDFYADGSPHYIYSLGNCPSCEYESKRRRDDLERLDWEAWSSAERLAEARSTELSIEYWQEERKKKHDKVI